MFAPSRYDRAQRGLTLIETMIAMAIGVAVTAVVMAMYPRMHADYLAAREADHVTSIVNNLHINYGTASNYGSISTSVLLNLKGFPSDMIIADGSVNNVWGGTVSVWPSEVVNNGFEINEQNVPAAACDNFVAKVQNAFTYIAVADTVIKTPNSTGTLDMAALSDACQSAASGVQILLDSR